MHTITINGFGTITGDTFDAIQSLHPGCLFRWMGHAPVSKDGLTALFMLHHRPVRGETEYQAGEITLLILAHKVDGEVKLHCVKETPNPTLLYLTPFDKMRVVDGVVSLEVDFQTSRLSLVKIFA